VAAALVEAENLSFSWPTGPAVVDVDLTVAAGEMVAVVGPNGAGKSTLLRLLSGFLKPTRGEVRWAGKHLASYGRRRMAQRLSFVPQYSEVNLPFRVEEMVMLGRYARLGPFRPPGPADRAAVERALAYAGVAALATRPVSQLSGGEFQRTVLARALAQGAEAIFLDEPTAHLDLSHQVQMLAVLRRLNREEGRTVVAALHDLNLAAAFFPRVCLLAGGRLVATGSPDEVFEEGRLAEIYGCRVRVVAAAGRKFIFPEIPNGKE